MFGVRYHGRMTGHTLFLLCASTLCALACKASVCTTVASGDIQDPGIWDCGCDPSACDSLFVLHDLFAMGSTTFANAYVEIGSAGVLTSGDTLTFTGLFVNNGAVAVHRIVQPWGTSWWVNHGVLSASVLWLWGDSVLNTGTIQAFDTLNIGPATRATSFGLLHGNYLWAGGLENHDTVQFSDAQLDLVLVNLAFCSVGGLCINLALISNEVGGLFHVDSLLSYGQIDNRGVLMADSLLQFGTDLFPNGELIYHPLNARIECGSLKNHGTITGQGDICVQDSTINYATGSITGSPDICDATLTATAEPFLDIDLGVVGAGVNWCAQTNCFNGVEEPHNVVHRLIASPQPATAQCTIVGALFGREATATLYSATGQPAQVRLDLFIDRVVLDLTNLAAGYYTCVVRSNSGAVVGTCQVLVAGS